MSKRFVFLSSALALVATSPFFASAQLNFGTLTTTLDRFKDVLGTLTTVIIALALIFFFWGLAKFILAAGEEEAKEEGKRIMFWGILAFVIMIGIWGIVNFLIGAFGITGTTAPNLPQVPR
ncbi:MAG: hypothetical protein AAB534_00590 [Patescibacteria group bacterium]